MKLRSYEINKTGIKGVCKLPGIWGHAAHRNMMFPIVYFKKPGWMSDETFTKVLDSICFVWPMDTEL